MREKNNCSKKSNSKSILLKKILHKPIKKDISYIELETLLKYYWYKKQEWSWSRVKFYNSTNKDLIILHKPHPWNILKTYQVKLIQDKLINNIWAIQ